MYTLHNGPLQYQLVLSVHFHFMLSFKCFTVGLVGNRQMGERTGCREGFCAECVGIQSYCIIVISEQYTLAGLNLLSCPEAIFFPFLTQTGCQALQSLLFLTVGK